MRIEFSSRTTLSSFQCVVKFVRFRTIMNAAADLNFGLSQWDQGLLLYKISFILSSPYHLFNGSIHSKTFMLLLTVSMKLGSSTQSCFSALYSEFVAY